MTEERIHQTLKSIAKGFVEWPNAPLLRNPGEAGLAFEEVNFQAE